MTTNGAGNLARSMAAGAVAAILAMFALTPVQAQELKFQLKFQGPVKLYAGFAAGGQSDILARILADKLKDRIGRAVVVENKTGAGGRIAVEAVKMSPADGSALVLANISHMSVSPLIYRDLPYDPVRDFTPISKVVEFQIALATGKQTGAQDMAAMLAWLKANPDKGTSGNPGNGSLPHLYDLELAAATQLDLRAVPYRGGAPIVAALTQGDLAIGWRWRARKAHFDVLIALQAKPREGGLFNAEIGGHGLLRVSDSAQSRQTEQQGS